MQGPFQASAPAWLHSPRRGRASSVVVPSLPSSPGSLWCRGKCHGYRQWQEGFAPPRHSRGGCHPRGYLLSCTVSLVDYRDEPGHEGEMAPLWRHPRTKGSEDPRMQLLLARCARWIVGSSPTMTMARSSYFILRFWLIPGYCALRRHPRASVQTAEPRIQTGKPCKQKSGREGSSPRQPQFSDHETTLAEQRDGVNDYFPITCIFFVCLCCPESRTRAARNVRLSGQWSNSIEKKPRNISTLSLAHLLRSMRVKQLKPHGA